MCARGRRLLVALVLVPALAAVAGPASASTSDCATKWSNFSAAQGGFITNYTTSGQAIRDMESPGDTSTGGANPTGSSDLASGSPGSYPGPYSTTDFGYYPGTVAWNPADTTTLNDDSILFRWRLGADPAAPSGNPRGLANNKYNVLLDVDGDGYKEFWILVDGNDDRVYLYYQNLNRQDIDTGQSYLLPSQFTALSESITDADTQCSTSGAATRVTSHTRSYATNDGTGDYFLEVQIPMSAFDDLNGNQMLFPDSPVAYVYSTGESNTDPLQKDLMQRLQAGALNLANPILFGDIVTPNGAPTVRFTDAAAANADFYLEGASAYVQVIDRLANTNPNAPDSVVVTVSNPTTGDDELVTLWETGNGTGVFTNLGGFCTAVQANPATPPQAWLIGVIGTGGVADGTFALSYLGASQWSVTGPWGTMPDATAGTAYSAGGVSFTLYQNSPQLPPSATTLSFCSRAADTLRLSGTAVVDQQDQYVRASGGETLHVTYTGSAITVTDTALVLGTGSSSCAGTAIIGFTRSDGLAAASYNITTTTAASDPLYVTVVSLPDNLSSTVADTITITISGDPRLGSCTDSRTFQLTETGASTAVFRNTTGVPARVANCAADGDDATVFEDIDGGVATATYTRGSCSYTASAQLFVTPDGGDVAFTNSSGTLPVTTYTVGDPLYATLTDANLSSGTSGCSAYVSPSTTVTIEARTAGGTLHDSETLTITETVTGSKVWRNGTALPTARWSLSAVSGNGILEAASGDTITVVYPDCNDGDAFAGNNTKTDTARFNAPDLVINRVLFAPDASVVGCQTEMVEIYNASPAALSLAGYRLTDETPDDDTGVDYTFPATVPSPGYPGGMPLQLDPGQKAVLSLSGTMTDFYGGVDGVGSFFLFNAGTGTPATYLGAADQLTLYDASGVAVDFVAWSNTASNTLDWVNDDTSAVTSAVWSDNQYRQAILGTDYSAGRAMVRVSDGYDRNLPADWTFASAADTTCNTVLAAATRVTLLGLRAERSGRIVFRTASQRQTAGFNVWATSTANGAGERLLTPEPIAARGSDRLGPVEYDAAIEPFTEDFVLLEELERGGASRFMGPFPVGDEALASSLTRPFADVLRLRGLSARRSAPPAPRTAPWRRPRSSLGQQREGAAVRIETTAAGVVTLAMEELAAAGLERRWLRAPRQLELWNLGRRVEFAVLPGGAGIRFRAEALRTDYSDTNVYVLAAPGAVGAGRPVPLTALGAPTAEGMQRVEEERYYAPFLPEGADPWFWDAAYEGGTPSLSFDLPGLVAMQGAVPVRLHLSTITEHAHAVEARVNGIPIGSQQWSGTGVAVLEGVVEGSQLRETGNVLEVSYSSEPHDGAGGVVIDALDLAVVLRPAGAVPATVEPWTAPPEAGARGVEYLIVSPPEFATAASRVASAKAAQGLRTRVVTTEQAYARHSGGVVEPNAIRELIREAGGTLRYVLLLGDDSSDPLDRSGLGSVSKVPSLYGYDGLFGYVASENRYADRDGDGRPDVAIGRLPASTVEQAELLADKVVRQADLLEAAHGHQTFAVDNSTVTDFDFAGRAREVAATFGAGSEQTWAELGSQPLEQARAALDEGLARGGIVHYLGHGADEFWADEHLLDVPRALAQAESGRASVVFAWTCNAQWYASPFGPGVDESLLLAPNGGAVAAFGPSGVTRPYLQDLLAKRVYEQLQGGGLTLGEAIRRAKAEILRSDPWSKTVVEGFNLLGDPALRLR